MNEIEASAASANHPFAQLTPDFVLDAVDACGLQTDGRLQALNSYENRVYQVGIEDVGYVIAKFYRPDRWTNEAILEEHSFTQALADHEIPAVPPDELPGGSTLKETHGFRVAIFPRRGGRAPETDDSGVLEWIGRFLGRIHAVGRTTLFYSRHALNERSFGSEPGAYVLAHSDLPADLREPYSFALQAALSGVRECFDRAGDIVLQRVHGDCHPGNIMWTDTGPHFVDFDDSCMGPAVQDLWMLIGGDRREMTNKLCDLLAGYEDFADFNPKEVELIEALRTLRMIHYAAWLARRWDDPAFPKAFPWFNSREWWEDHIGGLRDQIPRMAEAWRF